MRRGRVVIRYGLTAQPVGLTLLFRPMEHGMGETAEWVTQAQKPKLGFPDSSVSSSPARSLARSLCRPPRSTTGGRAHRWRRGTAAQEAPTPVD